MSDVDLKEMYRYNNCHLNNNTEMRYLTPLFAFVLSLHVQDGFAQIQSKNRLVNDWEFHRGDLGGVWEAIRSLEENSAFAIPRWDNVMLPHCFNGLDGVDPDQPYYQGAGWYRALINVKNSFRKGRTLLHFEGAGQKTEVYIYTTKVAAH